MKKGRAEIVVTLTDFQMNSIWITAIANIIEREDSYVLDTYDIERLRQIAVQLKCNDPTRVL